MKFDDVIEVSKNLSGCVGTIAAVVEKHYSLFPINPKIREDVFLFSCLAAVLTGFGAYRHSRTGDQWAGWIFLALFLVGGVTEVSLARGADAYIPPVAAALLARI